MTAKEVALTAKHVCLIMEFAAGGNMTAYVAKKSQGSTAAAAEGQLFMTEEEARYFYRVRRSTLLANPRPVTCGQYHDSMPLSGCRWCTADISDAPCGVVPRLAPVV